MVRLLTSHLSKFFEWSVKSKGTGPAPADAKLSVCGQRIRI